VTAFVGIVVSATTAYIAYRINIRKERRRIEHEVAAKIAAIPTVRAEETQIVAVQFAEGVLVVRQEDDVVNDRVFLPTGSRVTMGSDMSNHIIVDYPGVSKTHASFKAADSVAFVEPLGSVNSIAVNNRLISKSTKLRSGDMITINGVSQFSVQYVEMKSSN